MNATRILVATDFSDASEQAVVHATELAVALNAELCVVHVVSPAARPTWTAQVMNDDADMLTEAWVRDAGVMLGRLVTRLAEALPAVRGVVRVGLEAEEILCFAHEHRVSMIVVGMHGHGAASRLLLGSVTDRILRKSTCPVMAIPSQAYDATHLIPIVPVHASRLVS